MTIHVRLRGRTLAFLATSTIGLALCGQAAHAQDAPASAPPDEAADNQGKDIVITGSRIVRRDYDTDSPLVTVSADAMKNTAEVSLDQSLNKLPQFVPGSNQFTSGQDTQSTPTNSPGISTVNLRGLGQNRTLVLLDGRRTQPANASLVVDINTIPKAAIDGVEVITGGAGATYGADAVAGVVNFKIKRHFTGITLDGQYGRTFQDDGSQGSISALIGADFADGLGNAMIGASYERRSAVYARDRAWHQPAYTDPGTAGEDTFPNFGGVSSTIFASLPGAPTGSPFTQAAIDQVFTAKGYSAGDVARTATLYINPASTTGGATLFSIAPGVVSGRAAPGYTGALGPDYKLLSNGALASNARNGFISLPMTRYSVFGSTYYDVSDHIEAYLQANFNQNETRTEISNFTPAALQWSVAIPYDAATNGVASGHPVPTELATILNARANPNAAWGLNKELGYMGPRSIQTTTYTYEILGGLRGQVGLGDITYDLFGSHGRTYQNVDYLGHVDLARYQALISMPNYGANADFNVPNIGRLAHCTSGLNPFTTTPVSQDCKDIINANINTTTDLVQNQIELDLQGGITDLPAGELRFAVGADYRDDEFKYNPDPSLSTNNITSLTIGLFDVGATSGKTSVKEIYGELLIPVLKDVPFAQSLSINPGYRYSDYNTAGGVSTWKITGDWDINSFIKVRGGYQRANRAPNVAELFQPSVYLTVPWPDHDPCSIVTRASYGNVAANPDRAKVQALCTTLSGGFPITNTFTGNQSVYFPLGRDQQTGNPNLQTEKASTWTAGLVLRSPAKSGPFSRLTLSVDYYNIKIEGAIAPATTQFVYQECFNGFGTNPTYDPNYEYCQRIIRSSTNGFWLATKAAFQNLGMINTAGVDASLDWRVPVPGLAGQPGSVTATVVFNYLDKYEVQNNPGGKIFDYADSIGSPITAPPYGAQFRWKLYSRLGYDFGIGGIELGWRHLPKVRNVALVTNAASTALSTKAYDLFDLSGRVTVNKRIMLRGGIDNLFDRNPPIVGATPGVTNAAGTTDIAGSYDVVGRRFYIGAQVKL